MRALYAATFWVSAATLFFELTLTRLFSVTQWYHFAFMSVSVALLGFGASGTWLALHPLGARSRRSGMRLPPQSPDDNGQALLAHLSTVAVLFPLSILVAYLAMNLVPFDSYRVGWEQRQLLYLVLYYSALVLPFFLAGLFVALSLAAWPGRASQVYAANLLGSAAGSLGVLLLVPRFGGAGAVLCASIIGLLAALTLQTSALQNRGRRRLLCTRAGQWGLLIVLLLLVLRTPSGFSLHISPYKTLSTVLLSPEASIVFSRWNAFSRVDVVESKTIHSAPGLSLSFTGELPGQLGLLVDGGNLSPIPCIEEPDDKLFLRHLTTAFPFLLRPDAHVLLVEPRGGLDVWTALENGAATVMAVEGNSLIMEAVRQQAGRCGVSAYDDSRVTVVAEEARSHLQRSAERYDVLLVSLKDTYQPVLSGAYGLSESYAYTVEAFVEYLEHLQDDGILVVTRWMQSPPSEELRACALIAEALRQANVGDPYTHVLAFRSWSTATLLAKRRPFTSAEIGHLKRFCAERSFDLIHYPGMSVDEANRFNVLSDTAHYDFFRQVLAGDDRVAVLRDYPYAVSPPRDDQPFFFHYFKWSQVPNVLRMLGKTWQPFGGSGFLILVALLVLATLLSLLLIVLPLALRKAASTSADLGPVLLYFTCLGLGFLFVEMPLLQQFILFLGQPTYSFALVLFSILFFSGLGSLLSPRLPLRLLLLVLSVVVLAYPPFLSRLFALTIRGSLPLRLTAAVLGLAPLGFLLGVPMPGGIRLLERRAPELVPWAWAVNGCASVVSSILAVMGAVSFGFSRVLAAGALAYLLAWLAVPSLLSRQARVDI